MLLTFLIGLLALYIPGTTGDVSSAWIWPPLGVTFTMILNAVAYWVGSKTASRLGRFGGGGMRAVRTFKMLKVGIVGFVLVDVFAFHWPAFVLDVFTTGPAPGQPLVPLLGDLLLLTPLLVMIGTAMAFRYRFEKNRSGGRPTRLGLRRYLALRFRTELGILLFPWLALVMVSDVTLLIWGGSSYFPYIDTAVSLVLVAGLVTVGPAFLRIIWDTSSLPANSLRQRLEDYCEEHEFRCRDILVWHTHKHIPNAAVVGPLSAMRYVLVTDSLLENCTEEEIEGIFAHEVGHTRHHHLGFYLLFALTYGCLSMNLMDLVGKTGLVETVSSLFASPVGQGQAILMLAFTILYWLVGFGYVSRRMEQHADLFALRTSSNPRAFIRALEKLSLLSGRPSRAGSWRHFSIARRTRFLQEVLKNPERGRQLLRRVFRLRMAVVVAFVAGAIRLLLLVI